MDSSDEEDLTKPYNIKKIFTQFKKNEEKMTDTDTALSFIAHAAGVYELYCPAVQTRYYELKKKQLSTIFQDNELNAGDKPYFRGPSLVRKVLDNPNFDLSKIPEKDFVVEFLSHLRLHNRSEKRFVANFNNDSSSEVHQNTSWKLFNSKAAVMLDNKNVIKYPSFIDTRNEIVIFKKNRWVSYDKILNDLPLEERQALLIARINIKKAPSIEVLSHESLSLWYLLFGCEVIKNPAALIHHNMAFDLIKSDKLKWGTEMTKIIPMLKANGQIIKQAMKLNSTYSKFMPHEYLYQTENSYNLTDLVTREANITKAWLELKLGKGVSSYLINQCATDTNAVQAIWQLIIESFDEWGLPNTRDVELIRSPAESESELESDSDSDMEEL